MKVNLIGMILNNAGRRCFDGLVSDDNAKALPAADSLHTLIMEYAKVVNGGKSDLVVASREVLVHQQEATCATCKHKNTDQRVQPCVECFACAKWEPKALKAVGA